MHMHMHVHMHMHMRELCKNYARIMRELCENYARFMRELCAYAFDPVPNVDKMKKKRKKSLKMSLDRNETFTIIPTMWN